MKFFDKSGYVLQEYARLAKKYDKRWGSYVTATIAEMIKRLNLKPKERLLDVGCGTGELLYSISLEFPEAEIAGVDASKEMLAVARDKLKARIDLKEAYAHKLPFSDEHFDVIVSCSAFHFFENPRQDLLEFRRVLKPQGRIVIVDWCHDYLSCRIHDLFLRLFNRAHLRTYGTKEFESMIRGAKFSSIKIERYKINWLWGMMTAQALK